MITDFEKRDTYYHDGNFRYEFIDAIGGDDPGNYKPLSHVYISADKSSPAVWVDTYGKSYGSEQQSTYDHLTPELAEEIGMALIMAARIAKGEVKL